MPTVPDLAGNQKKQAWEEVALHPSLLAAGRLAAGPAGLAQEERLLPLRNATPLPNHC